MAIKIFSLTKIKKIVLVTTSFLILISLFILITKLILNYHNKNLNYQLLSGECRVNEDCPHARCPYTKNVCKNYHCVTVDDRGNPYSCFSNGSNKASEYCLKREGRLEVRTTPNGEKYRVCIFEDGSECEIWKFYNNQCRKKVFNPKDDWWEGQIFALPQGNQFNDYFEMLNYEQIGIQGQNPEIEEQLKRLRNQPKLVKLKGQIIQANDFNGKRLIVEKIMIEK